MKIVINKCYGGFGLSYEAMKSYAARKGFELFAYTDDRAADGSINFDRKIPFAGEGRAFVVYYSRSPLDAKGQIPSESYISNYDIERNDPDLVAVVEQLGTKANGDHAKLAIVEVPDGVEWEIDEYDGIESIDEKHRSWG